MLMAWTANEPARIPMTRIVSSQLGSFQLFILARIPGRTCSEVTGIDVLWDSTGSRWSTGDVSDLIFFRIDVPWDAMCFRRTARDSTVSASSAADLSCTAASVTSSTTVSSATSSCTAASATSSTTVPPAISSTTASSVTLSSAVSVRTSVLRDAIWFRRTAGDTIVSASISSRAIRDWCF